MNKTLLANFGIALLSLLLSPIILAETTTPTPTPPSEKSVVFLGDSLTAGYGVDPAEAYPSLVRQKIREAHLPFEVQNAGLSGDTSAAALRRVDWLLQRPIDILVIALGVAYGASEWFGISFALGAFFAGMILSESTLSQRAAEETLPLRDAFAVLFFVSVGMLFNPGILLHNPVGLIGTLFVVLVFNPIAAYLVVRLFRQSIATAITIGASLAQIGEFSFVLAGLGMALKILPQEGRDLILAAAIISIMLNPFYFAAITYLKKKLQLVDVLPAKPAVEEPEELQDTKLTDHAVIIGYGRVGTILGSRLREDGHPYLVIEDRKQAAETIRQSGIEVIQGNAADPRVIKAANLPAARWLFIAIPDGFEAGQVAEQARKLNPQLDIIARAHSDAEVEHLQKHKANFVIMGEREIAAGMLDHAFGDKSQV